jgi:hypothetical protein
MERIKNRLVQLKSDRIDFGVVHVSWCLPFANDRVNPVAAIDFPFGEWWSATGFNGILNEEAGLV